ncbi:MAG TPA: rRNA maturation RNase YbeY [Acetobacteraceae bacterium]|nr:rRNA maturation RNase YbeY [Acetobacteraceae bacterium]
MPSDHSRFLPGAGGVGDPGGGIAAPLVTIDDPAWRRTVPNAVAVARRAARAAGGAGSVVLTSDRTVKQLNSRHRGRNKPTNVLTFETGGEVILAHGVIRREAAAARRRPAHHLAHLVVHGALHLQGHDHHHPGDARRMEMAEARILRRLGLPNPWRPA